MSTRSSVARASAAAAAAAAAVRQAETQQRTTDGAAPMEGIGEPPNPIVGVPNSDAAAAIIASAAAAAAQLQLQQQLAAMQQQMAEQARLMQQQQQLIDGLRASPAHSPQLSPAVSPDGSPRSNPVRQAAPPQQPGAAAEGQPQPQAAAPAAPESRFARKEPRAHDLREYDGSSGAKLDEWLQELALAVQLFRLNELEATTFAVSRLRGAALQWWLAQAQQEQAPLLADGAALATALRTRFQPVTTARMAREQLDRLTQGARGVNDYIADFQRLRTQLTSMSEDDALHAFERGLRRDLAEKLRVQGVTTVQEAIALAARVGGITQAAASSGAPPRAASAAQMDIDCGDGIEERIARTVLNALSAQNNGGMMGIGAKTQARMGYQQERAVSAAQRPFSKRFSRGAPRPLPVIPGVPTHIVEQRRAANLCYRCGSAEHASRECPNATSASSHSSN